ASRTVGRVHEPDTRPPTMRRPSPPPGDASRPCPIAPPGDGDFQAPAYFSARNGAATAALRSPESLSAHRGRTRSTDRSSSGATNGVRTYEHVLRETCTECITRCRASEGEALVWLQSILLGRGLRVRGVWNDSVSQPSDRGSNPRSATRLARYPRRGQCFTPR